MGHLWKAQADVGVLLAELLLAWFRRLIWGTSQQKKSQNGVGSFAGPFMSDFERSHKDFVCICLIGGKQNPEDILFSWLDLDHVWGLEPCGSFKGSHFNSGRALVILSGSCLREWSAPLGFWGIQDQTNKPPIICEARAGLVTCAQIRAGPFTVASPRNLSGIPLREAGACFFPYLLASFPPQTRVSKPHT